MESNKKRSFKFINKIANYSDRNINYNCFRFNKNKSIIFLLGIILFSFYYKYFYIYCDINIDLVDYRKLDIIDYTKLNTNDYIELNTTKYTKVNTTTNDKNNKKLEIEDFNDELFCPIINLEKNQDEYRLLSDIKYLQFGNGECNFNDPNEKFFILDFQNNICEAGLFSYFWCLSLYFSDSLLLNRKFLIKNEMEICR